MAGTRYLSQLLNYPDANGDPLVGGKLYFFETGTTTPLDTYSDRDLTTPNAHPIILNASGRSPVPIWLIPDELYRAQLRTSADVTVATDDPVAGSDIAGAIQEHNDDPTAHFDATETDRGMVILANPTEVQAGIDDSKAVTPAGLATLTASATRAGLVEKATDAETVEGTDDERYVTPENIQHLQATAAEIVLANGTTDTLFMGPNAFADNASEAQNGYFKMPGGITFQWGRFTAGTDSTTSVLFPIAFPTACYSALVDGGRNSDADDNAPIVLVSTITTTGFDVFNDGGSCDCTFWAVGK